MQTSAEQAEHGDRFGAGAGIAGNGARDADIFFGAGIIEADRRVLQGDDLPDGGISGERIQCREVPLR